MRNPLRCCSPRLRCSLSPGACRRRNAQQRGRLPQPARRRGSGAAASRSSSQEFGGAETGPARRLCRSRSAGASRPFPASPTPARSITSPRSTRGRERLRGARRLCLRHAPADGPDGRRGRAGLRARPRNRPYRRQPCPAARSRLSAAARSGASSAQILGAVVGNNAFGSLISQGAQQFSKARR